MSNDLDAVPFTAEPAPSRPAPQPSNFIPSAMQQDVFDWIDGGSGHANIIAVAGSGKTTTLIEGMAHMTGRVTLAAFNKKIAVEIQNRLKDREINGEAATFHSIGFRAWRQLANRGCRTNTSKIYDIMDEMNAELGEDTIPKTHRVFLNKLVSIARQSLIGVPGYPTIDYMDTWWAIIEHFDLTDDLPGDPTPDETVAYAIRTAQSILERSIDQAPDVIDFDDMLYMPLQQGASFPRFDWTLIDEAQDTNAARREIASRLLGRGRLIAVGDPCQAIYGFTGADSEAMNLLADKIGGVTELPLTVSYRCPQAVVRTAQQWVSHIQSHPDAPEGVSTSMSFEEFDRLGGDLLNSRAAILCRNTAPIVSLAYRFLRKDIPCKVEGREIGAGLIRLISKWRVRSLQTLLDRLDEYTDREAAKFTAMRKMAKVQRLYDQQDTIIAIAAGLPANADVEDLRAKIENLFADTDEGRQRTLILSTIHKAKGREWDRVYWYGSDTLQPSRFATLEWEQEQEDNLCYVAATRAKQELIRFPLNPEEQRRSNRD